MKEIQKGIASSNSIIFILSPDSITSEYCLIELECGIQLNKRLIPIHYRKVDSISVHKVLRNLQWIDFQNNLEFDDSFETLGRVGQFGATRGCLADEEKANYKTCYYELIVK